MSLELTLEKLERAYALGILYSLEELGSQNKQALTASLTKSTNPVRDRLNELKKLELIEIEEVRTRNNKEYFVSLTEKGKRIAELVVQIENILNE